MTPLSVLSICLQDLRSNRHATGIPSFPSVALRFPDVGKYFVAQLIFTCGFNFASWRFQHRWRHCIICHLLMTYNSKTLLIFPKAKNSKTIWVIVFHLESNPNGGCKSEMRCEIERGAQHREGSIFTAFFDKHELKLVIASDIYSVLCFYCNSWLFCLLLPPSQTFL